MVTIAEQATTTARLAKLENALVTLKQDRARIAVAVRNTDSAEIIHTAFKTAIASLDSHIKKERQQCDVETLAHYVVNRALDGHNPLAAHLACAYCPYANESDMRQTVVTDFINACKEAGELLELSEFLIAELEARGDFIREVPGEFFTVDDAEYIITDRVAGYLLQK